VEIEAMDLLDPAVRLTPLSTSAAVVVAAARACTAFRRGLGVVAGRIAFLARPFDLEELTPVILRLVGRSSGEAH
jgi:hypothetical protein